MVIIFLTWQASLRWFCHLDHGRKVWIDIVWITHHPTSLRGSTAPASNARISVPAGKPLGLRLAGGRKFLNFLFVLVLIFFEGVQPMISGLLSRGQVWILS